VCFYHRQHVVYWHGASLESAFAVRPVHRLFHRTIEHACVAGHRWFDFNPSGGLEGVIRFKDGFGCQRLSADVYEGTTRLARILRATRDLVRRRP
jgi:hypothetical protein